MSLCSRNTRMGAGTDEYARPDLDASGGSVSTAQ